MRVKTLQRVRLPNQSVRIMRDILIDAGVASDAALSAADLTAEIVDQPGATVSGVQELAFQRAFVAATAGRQDLWMKVGWSYSLLTLGAVGLAAMTASTLGTLISTLSEFADFTFWLDGVREIHNEAGRVIGVETVMRDVPSELREFTLYRNLGMSMRTVGEVCYGAPSPLTAVEMPLRLLPFDHCSLTGTPIKHGRAARWLWQSDTILPSYNELLHRLYRRQCEDQASRLAAEFTVADQVRELLVTAVPPGREIHHVAEELHLSVRSLQRMLHIEGVSYRDLQRDVRESAAKRMLRSSELGVGEIGRRLGYHDTANFCAAFRAWTGITPSAWRTRNVAAYATEQSA
jgi:AraC-like DNA-binding protein